MATVIDFSSLIRAIESLESALEAPPRNDLERDGVIQRFEYTFELCWKMIRRVLLAQGRNQVSASPRPLLRSALSEGYIDDILVWFAFLEARNSISHAYNAQFADEVYKKVCGFPVTARALLTKLQQHAS